MYNVPTYIWDMPCQNNSNRVIVKSSNSSTAIAGRQAINDADAVNISFN